MFQNITVNDLKALNFESVHRSWKLFKIINFKFIIFNVGFDNTTVVLVKLNSMSSNKFQ